MSPSPRAAERESGGGGVSGRPSRASRTRWVGGWVFTATVSTMGGGHRAATSHGAKVDVLWAGGVGAAVRCPLVVEGADRACWMFLFTDGGSMAVALTISAASGFVG